MSPSTRRETILPVSARLFAENPMRRALYRAMTAALAIFVASGTASATVPEAWTLEQVVETALANHPLIAQVDAETRAARGRQTQAASGYYPSVTGSAGLFRSRAWSQLAHQSATINNLSLSGSLNYVISDFGRTSASVGQADALLAAAKSSGRLTRSDVAFGARLAYINVLRAQRVLDVRNETGHQRQALLTQAMAYYEAGLRARIDVARAEANLYQARAELAAAENDLRFARATLLERMGLDGPPEFTLAESQVTPDTPPGSVEDWMRAAEKKRSDLRAAADHVQAADEALRQAQAGYNPVLTGSAGYGYGADDLPLRQNYGVGLQLSVPIFNGYLTRGQIAEAESRGASARYGLAALQRQVRLQVEQVSLALRLSVEQIQARKKQRDAAEENLRLATGRYEAGAGDIIEMIDAQTQASEAETALVETRYDYNTALASLSRAIGE